jgi:thiol-disulfide isomerase/thioredoxin
MAAARAAPVDRGGEMGSWNQVQYTTEMRGIALVVVMAAAAVAQTHEPRRGVLESPGGELPFVMSEIMGPYRLYHGAHSVQLTQQFEGTETMVIPFPPYDSRIVGRYARPRPEGGIDEPRFAGTWTKTGPNGATTMPFRWEPWPLVDDTNDRHRKLYGPLFPLPGEPFDVAGRWRVQFGSDATPAVAIFAPSDGPFVQVPGEVIGTFLTVTGDYRYLAGTARGDELRLSCFDGAHAFLFAAKRQPDGSLRGDFWSGTSWHEAWTAVRDDAAALPDAFTLTKPKPDVALAELAFAPASDPTATPVPIGDHLGRTTLVVLFGTWCPNCGDAGTLLKELLDVYGDRGLRVLGLAFEHGDDHERHRRVLADYRQRYAAAWPVLLAGSSDKARASASFPAIDAVRAYPTTLFVDSTGTIRAVHQGFAGPATGDAHAQQRAAFASLVERLLAERPPQRPRDR